jgi:hypothetical protein
MIAERLRHPAWQHNAALPTMREAADEIERLEGISENLCVGWENAEEKRRLAEEENEQLRAALSELTDLMQGVIDGDYRPDSFTLQPARAALTATKREEP